ncbi:hypothetical protein AMJ85_01900 [candidate division BRC1 bacterium SM23_51]|nr:MAG: hypothetical protein AMJ85_01900 [candidate division BRC1 bacterium SM23_51]
MRSENSNLKVQMAISPLGWGLEPAGKRDSKFLAAIGLAKRDLESRARHNTYDWLRGQFNHEFGAFHGFYDARTRTLALPQTVNLIAPFQLMAAFDRYEDAELLAMARRSSDWIEANIVETHPMSLVLGGVLDNIKPTQLWTKYTADYVTLNLGLWQRLGDEEHLARAIRGSKFLLQSQNHDFAPKYDHWHERWIERGWQSFGRVVVAMLALAECTEDGKWHDRAKVWAEHGLSLQAENGCFYLINNDYYSSDIAADEIRALVLMHWHTGDKRFLAAAVRFADWHLENQAANATWPLSEDRWGEEVTEYVGPGDVPNISIALLKMHRATGELKYVVSAVKALRYSLTQQQLPGRKGQPYIEDPATHWGYWSWDPPHDYTMSADQSTHHVRGYWFFLDYFLSLPRHDQAKVAEMVAKEKA